MEITYTSSNYVEGTYSYKRYIRKLHTDPNCYFWCETDEFRNDVRQGTVAGEELPDRVKMACDLYTGAFYATEWPLR